MGSGVEIGVAEIGGERALISRPTIEKSQKMCSKSPALKDARPFGSKSDGYPLKIEPKAMKCA
jgi:hypothetical protein